MKNSLIVCATLALMGSVAACGTALGDKVKQKAAPSSSSRALKGEVESDVTQVIAIDTAGAVYNAVLNGAAFAIDLAGTDKPVHLFVTKGDGTILPMKFQTGQANPFTTTVPNADAEINLALLSADDTDEDSVDDAVVPENNPAEEIDSDDDGESDFDDADDDNDGEEDGEDADDDGNGRDDEEEDLDSDDDGSPDYCDSDDDDDGIEDDEDSDHGEGDHDGDGVSDEDDADDDNDGEHDDDDADDDDDGVDDEDEDEDEDEGADDSEGEDSEGADDAEGEL